MHKLNIFTKITHVCVCVCIYMYIYIYTYRLKYIYILEKEMATHYSTLAWKIPWMEGRGRLQSMGSQSRT